MVRPGLIPRAGVSAADETWCVIKATEGDAYVYEKLLLATGGIPRRLPFGGEDVIYYRTVQDYRKLRALSEEKRPCGRAQHGRRR